MYLKIFAYVLCLLSVIYAAKSSKAPYITKCFGGDSECIKKNTVNMIPILTAGIPEFGVETMDPMYFKKIDASTPLLKLVIKDAQVLGLKSCVVNNIKHDTEHLKIYLTIQCTLDLSGKYAIDGQILFLPLKGKGNTHIKLRKAELELVADIIEKAGDDGKTHYHIKSTKYTYKLNEKVDFDIDNLFSGNEALSKAAREVINANSNELILEISPPMVKQVFNKIIDNINNFLRAVPKEDLTLD